jgi:hypothetical protein
MTFGSWPRDRIGRRGRRSVAHSGASSSQRRLDPPGQGRPFFFSRGRGSTWELVLQGRVCLPSHFAFRVDSEPREAGRTAARGNRWAVLSLFNRLSRLT